MNVISKIKKKLPFLGVVRHNIKIYKMRLFLYKNKRKCLDDFNIIAEKLGVEYWLEYGTMLGAIRNNKIIPHDFDFDFSINREQWSKNIRDTLSENGFELIQDICIDNKVIEEKYIYHGINVDIFYCVVKDGYIYTPVFRTADGLSWSESIKENGGVNLYEFKNQYTGLKNIVFEDVVRYIPIESNSHLVSYYGADFLIPNRKWDGNNSAQETKYIGVVNEYK
ncbi:LicD family protein [Photobacterium damselae]|uniref:LicD family protein n=1 Tax=Photobacterium damselae TaxID=38293 RepID=UPI002543DCB9